MIRIALADDHALFRTSLASWLRQNPKFEVVLECQTGKELVHFIERKPVDVVLLDIQMPEMDGMQTCDWLTQHKPEVKVIVVSFLTDVEVIYKLMQKGAQGYFSKEAEPEELEEALLSYDPTAFFFNRSLRHVVQEAKKWSKKVEHKEEKRTDEPLFTHRELEVLRLIGQGKKSVEIADEMDIDVRTIESHRRNIIDKTPAKNMIGAVLYALKEGYIQLDFS
jgi:DNA-binding NarL/FixJ family response regulator